MKSHMNNLRSILDSLLTHLDDDRFILLLILRIVMNEFICFVCVHKIKEHPAKNQSVSSFLKCLKFLLLLDECLSAFFHMSKTRFKRFSQQLNGIICITAHIIYTYFVICIRQVEDVLPPDRWLDSLSLSRKKNRSINSSTSGMQLTKNVYMMRAVMQIIPFSC